MNNTKKYAFVLDLQTDLSPFSSNVSVNPIVFVMTEVDLTDNLKADIRQNFNKYCDEHEEAQFDDTVNVVLSDLNIEFSIFTRPDHIDEFIYL